VKGGATSVAAWPWIVLAAIVVLFIIVMALMQIPQARRYLRMKSM